MINRIITLEQFCKENGVKYERLAQDMLNGDVKSSDFCELFEKWNAKNDDKIDITEIVSPALWHIRSTESSKQSLLSRYSFIDKLYYQLAEYKSRHPI